MTQHIPLFGATGRTRRPVLEEALRRGLRVVALVRRPEALSSDAPSAKPVSPPSCMTGALRHVLASAQTHGLRRVVVMLTMMTVASAAPILSER